MRVLVCGGRDFADSALLYGVLDELNRTKTIICVIEGDAPGADRLAGQWARRNHIDLKVIVLAASRYSLRSAAPHRKVFDFRQRSVARLPYYRTYSREFSPWSFPS
jgi:SLOG family YspA-like protein